MNAIYCKSKRTYTNKCDCDDRCPHYWKQGIGSLTGNVVSNVTNTSSERTDTQIREGEGRL